MLANVRVHFSKGKKKQARHKPNNQHLSNPPFASHLPVSSLQNSGRRPAMAPRYRVDIADHFPGINATLSSPPPSRNNGNERALCLRAHIRRNRGKGRQQLSLTRPGRLPWK